MCPSCAWRERSDCVDHFEKKQQCYFKRAADPRLPGRASAVMALHPLLVSIPELELIPIRLIYSSGK